MIPKKEFFKPDKAKIIIFLILLILISIIPKPVQLCNSTPEGVDCINAWAKGIGFPIVYGEQYSGDTINVRFNLINLLINIIIYYFLACVMIYAWRHRYH
ncbi:hypothetical protein JW868_01700 [Candidatus Woesearchaeota archaeon]|nr:hypothetical protein [Candidatus Woesearchaeota archaeon]